LILPDLPASTNPQQDAPSPGEDAL